MVRTKQTARTESGSTRGKPSFLHKTDSKKDSPGSSSRTEDTEPRKDTEPRVDTETSETGPGEVEPREVESAASTNPKPSNQIVLPRHTSVGGMDPTFIRYYRENGMTPYLVDSLVTKRGWTLQMVNKVIHNCNAT